jgi:glycosyltransferase involved in cell wall biosynthesis
MNGRPDVSVVMGAYNGSPHDLTRAVCSVLTQEGVSLELIVVDDGSTGETPSILDEYARRDARMKVIRQSNQGLTRALIKGCAAAQGEYISRQDVGDVSLPGRFARQLTVARNHPDASLVSCGTRFVGPKGEFLYDVVRNPSEATEGLLSLRLHDIKGPSSHPSAMFTRRLYRKVGGYRFHFYFAQDLDLWVRLAEQGPHITMPEILYQASFSVGAISASYRKEQMAAAKLVLECARRRRSGASELPALVRANHIRASKAETPGRLARAKALYFIGACLSNTDKREASNYFKRAIRTYPLHLKSAVRLVTG